MNEKGFILAESVVAMALTTVAVIIVSLVYTSGYRSYIKEADKIEVQENLRLALNRIAGEIRTASAVTDPAGGPQIIFTKKNAAGGSDSIRYYYDPAGKEIQKSINGVGNNPVSSNITSLSFVYDSSEASVLISASGSKGQSGTVSLQTKVSLRLPRQ